MARLLGWVALLLAGLLGIAIAGSRAAPPAAPPPARPADTCVALNEDFESGTLGAFVSPASPYWSVTGPPGARAAQSVVTYPAGGGGGTVIETGSAVPVPPGATQATYSFGFGLYYISSIGDYGTFYAEYRLDNQAWQQLTSNSTYGFHTYTFDVSSWAGHAVDLRFTASFGSCCENSSATAYLDNVQVSYTAPACLPVPSATPTPPVPPSPTPHAGRFQDVPPPQPFYFYIECLGGRGIINGYACGGPGEPCYTGNKPYFRPGNALVRGQTAKIVVLSAGFTDPVPSGQQTFADVPPSQPFWLWIEQLAGRGIISGYTCGGPGELCDPALRPYFRPYANVTRGQLAKIAANAVGYQDPIPTAHQAFEDVPYGQPFWLWVELVVAHSVISGYQCGGPGEPCVPPNNRPYFRPGNDVTRAQTAKIGTITFFPNCQDRTPTPTAIPPAATATPTAILSTVTPTPTAILPTVTATPTSTP